jgi:hypothetical protein
MSHQQIGSWNEFKVEVRALYICNLSQKKSAEIDVFFWAFGLSNYCRD